MANFTFVTLTEIIKTPLLAFRQLVFNHKQSIAEQMKEESDPAMTLHLAATLLFNVFTQCMVHAPGRCVPSIIAFLKPHMEPDSHQTLVTCQGDGYFKNKPSILLHRVSIITT